MRPLQGGRRVKLWLDDVRPAPDGWTWAKTAREAIGHLNAHGPEIVSVSLDHDLGKEGDGQEVARHIAGYRQLDPSTPIRVHSWNPAGARVMAHWMSEAGYRVEVRPFEFAEVV